MAAVPATGKKVTIPAQLFFYRVRCDQIMETRPDPIAGGATQGRFEQMGQRGTMRTAVTTHESVRLRPVQPGDLPRMYEMQLDPESNRMAGTIPRTAEVFDSHWAKVLDVPGGRRQSHSRRRGVCRDHLRGGLRCAIASIISPRGWSR
jgi:hypothetical protein